MNNASFKTARAGALASTVFLVLVIGFFSSLGAAADSSSLPPTERIGIYDSRAIAYADFWSKQHQQKIKELANRAGVARETGQTNLFKELDTALKKEQARAHLQVFSTAPVDNVLAGMKERVEAVQKEAGVSRLVSKWDEKTLQELKYAKKVDLTDLLLREFSLDEKQQKMVADLQTKDPLPLKKAEKLMKEGKL